jgi:hypothetical protein
VFTRSEQLAFAYPEPALLASGSFLATIKHNAALSIGKFVTSAWLMAKMTAVY